MRTAFPDRGAVFLRWYLNGYVSYFVTKFELKNLIELICV